MAEGLGMAEGPGMARTLPEGIRRPLLPGFR